MLQKDREEERRYFDPYRYGHPGWARRKHTTL
jgi:hypothetical protein